MIDLDAGIVNLIIQIIVNIIILAPVLWISGRLLAGKEKAKFMDALWIVILGTVISAIFQALFAGILASLILLVILLGLVKHFFDTGWLRALAIAIVALIIWAVILIILIAIIGLAIIGGSILI